MVSGMEKTRSAGTTTRSAYAPHWTMARTRWPGRTRVTPGPIAVTTPASSWPGLKGSGGFTWYFPWTMRMSGKLQPMARVSTRTSPGPGAGSGSSCHSRSAGSPQRVATSACMNGSSPQMISRSAREAPDEGVGARREAGEELDSEPGGPAREADLAILDEGEPGHQLRVPAGVEGAHRLLDEGVRRVEG